jgi:hypothetical protein
MREGIPDPDLSMMRDEMLNLTQKLFKIFAEIVGSEEFTRAAREPIPVTQILANLMITHLYSNKKCKKLVSN